MSDSAKTTARFRERVLEAEAEATKLHAEKREVEASVVAPVKLACEAYNRASKEAEGRWTELYQHAFSTGVISKPVINVLAPTHDRNDCSDDDLINGYRCTRCWLLLALKNPHGICEVRLQILVKETR